MGARHTPGPWNILGEDDLPEHDDLMIVAFDIYAPGTDEDAPQLFVCNIGSGSGQRDWVAPREADDKWPVSLANARLIAAAPVPLEVCEAALAVRVKTHGANDPLAEMLFQAVSEANGA